MFIIVAPHGGPRINENRNLATRDRSMPTHVCLQMAEKTVVNRAP